MRIMASVEVPEGNTCFFQSGHICPWQLKHTGSGQRWCRIFNDTTLSRSGEKCQDCKNASGKI